MKTTWSRRVGLYLSLKTCKRYSLWLLIGLVLAPFVGRADQLAIGRSGTNVVLSWTNPAAVLQSSPTISGVWLPVSGAISPLLVRPTNAANFYRLLLTSQVFRINSSSGPNGVINPAASLLVNQGAGQSFSATADAGFTVDVWYRNGSPVQTNGSGYALANIQANADVFVTFRPVSGPPAGTNSPPVANPPEPPVITPPNGPGPWIGLSDGNLTETYSGSAQCPCLGVPGGNLNLSLTYNSADADGSWARLDATVGFGWTHCYNVFLFSQNGQIFRYGADGRVTKYIRQLDGVTYLPGPGIFETVVSNAPSQFTLTTKDQTVFTFKPIAGTPFSVGSAVYRLTQEVDRNQNTNTLSYSSGRLISVIDPYGRTLTFSNNISGHLVSFKDPLGRTTTLGYDASGAQLTSITDPQGRTVQYSYNPLHQLSQRVDKDGRVLVFTYQRGKPVAITDGNAQQYFRLSNPLNWAVDPFALTNEQRTVYQPSTTTKTDGAGHLWTFSYDENGAITHLVAPDGAAVSYSYDPATLLVASTSDPNQARTTYFQYDALGNRTSVTDIVTNTPGFPTNITAIYSYEPIFSQTTSMMDPNGRLTTYEYDTRGNLTNSTDALGGTMSFTYDSRGNVLSMQDKRGYLTTYQYDSNGNRTNTTDALGHVTSYAYDSAGNRTAMIDANGHRTSYVYDNLDRVIRITNAAGGVTTYTYDGASRQTRVTDANTNSTSYSYDARGLLGRQTNALGAVMSYGYDANNNRIAVTNELGHVTTYAYDLRNRLVRNTNGVGGVSTYTYDPNGNRLRVVDPSGVTNNYAYDSMNRLVQTSDALGVLTTYSYDNVGNRLSLTDGNGNTTTYSYDALDRLVRTTDMTGSSQVNIHDPAGNLVQAVNGQNQATLMVYDPVSRLVSVTDPLNQTLVATFDPAGNPIQVTDAKGGIYFEGYDARNLLTNFTDAFTNQTTWTYDAGGRRISKTDALHLTTTYQYDGMGRVTGVHYPGGSAVAFQYDLSGRMTRATDAGSDFSYEYDAADQLTKVTDEITGQIINYQRNRGGQVTNMTGPNGITIAYTYNQRRQLASIRRNGVLEASLSYNGAGQVISKTLGNGSITLTTYDAAGHIASIDSTRSNNTPLYHQSFTRDTNFNVVQMVQTLTRTNGTQEFTIVNYAYDDAQRLVGETRRDGNTLAVLFSATYQYDANGNRVLMVRDGQPTTYEYNGDRLVRETNGPDVINYTYNAYGSLQTEQHGAQTVTYQYDHENRLVGINGPGLTISFILAPDGKRLARTVNGVTTAFTYDGLNVLQESSTNSLTKYLYEPGVDAVLLKEKSGSKHYYHRGNVNSVQGLTDGSQQVVNTYDYDAFGVPRITEEGTSNPFRFGAARPEGADGSDYYYFRERLYSARTGRFQSVDPLRVDAAHSVRIGQLPALSGDVSYSTLFEARLTVNVTGMDLAGYVYTGNNPGNFVDPTGEVIIWNPASASVTSGCLGSGCLLSGCLGSGCGGSACGGSGCGGSACLGSGCGGSLCGASGCGGSLCGGSVCIGSGCGGSVCGGSACGGSVCVGSLCAGSVCAGSGCGGSVCAGSACIGSACGGSVCVGSACGISICWGSACIESVCGGSGCVFSICGGTGCGGSVCIGSGCGGSACWSSGCIFSMCHEASGCVRDSACKTITTSGLRPTGTTSGCPPCGGSTPSVPVPTPPK